MQTPSVFESYFANEKYTTGTTIKQRIEKQPNTSYEINESVISYVYEILNNDAFILSRAQFSTLVENADFSSIYGIMSKNKAKIKPTITTTTKSSRQLTALHNRLKLSQEKRP